MTTIESKSKSVLEILDEREVMAAKGSCKTCQFCLKDDSQGMEYYCAIQGNVNPISFTEVDLDREPYPYGPCDDGNWHNIEGDGTTKPILGCLAYKPRMTDNISYGDVLVSQHWNFMDCLAKAAKLHYDIEDVRSGKAQAKLDELLKRLNTGDFSDYSLL